MRAPLLAVVVLAAMACVPAPLDPLGEKKDEPRDLIARLKSAPPSARDRMVRDAIERNGGTPLIEHDEALFLVERESGAPPLLLADFNGWGEPEDRLPHAAMTPLEGSRWYYLKRALDPRARVEYAIARESTEDAALHLDPENPRTVEGFSRRYSELRMPAHPEAPELIDEPTLPKGRLVDTEVESRIRGNRRRILVYLPPGYDESGERRFPTAYFGDASAYVTNVPVPRILDSTIARGTVRPLIAVFVEPAPRREEYRMNPDYRRFLVEELVPWVDERYRTIASPESRAILGGSRGGLAAVDAAYHHSETFGGCGAIAPAISPTNLVELIANGEAEPVRFFVLVGLYDLDWRKDGVALMEALRARGYDVGFLEIPEGHSWNAWKSHIDDALVFLFPGEGRSS